MIGMLFWKQQIKQKLTKNCSIQISKEGDALLLSFPEGKRRVEAVLVRGEKYLLNATNSVRIPFDSKLLSSLCSEGIRVEIVIARKRIRVKIPPSQIEVLSESECIMDRNYRFLSDHLVFVKEAIIEEARIKLSFEKIYWNSKESIDVIARYASGREVLVKKKACGFVELELSSTEEADVFFVIHNQDLLASVAYIVKEKGDHRVSCDGHRLRFSHGLSLWTHSLGNCRKAIPRLGHVRSKIIKSVSFDPDCNVFRIDLKKEKERSPFSALVFFLRNNRTQERRKILETGVADSYKLFLNQIEFYPVNKIDRFRIEYTFEGENGAVLESGYLGSDTQEFDNSVLAQGEKFQLTMPDGFFYVLENKDNYFTYDQSRIIDLKKRTFRLTKWGVRNVGGEVGILIEGFSLLSKVQALELLLWREGRGYIVSERWLEYSAQVFACELTLSSTARAVLSHSIRTSELSLRVIYEDGEDESMPISNEKFEEIRLE